MFSRVPWRIIKRALIDFVVPSVPVVLFLAPVVFTSRALPNDWDYFLQLYAAARQSIVDYHQFPWWNPYVAGGVPLYANPQFGFFSIQMLLVMIVGVEVGLRLSLLVYFLLGFWGVYLLVGEVRKCFSLTRSRLLQILLGYTFVFTGFINWHLYAGHFTFLNFLLIPLLLFFLARILNSGKGYIGLSALGLLIILSSQHYSSLLAAVSVVLFIGVFLIAGRNLLSLRIAKKLAASLVVILLLAAHKLYFVYEYYKDYPRILDVNESNPLLLISRALLQPVVLASDPLIPGARYMWWEYSSYLSIFFVLFIGSVLFGKRKKKSTERFRKAQYITLGFSFVFCLIALGSFFELSPYSLIRDLPVFRSMIVPTRWLGLATLFAILSAGLVPKMRKYQLALLSLAVVELFTIHNWAFVFMKSVQPIDPASRSSSFQNVEISRLGFEDKEPIYQWMRAGYGLASGYEPILGYDEDRPTRICGVESGCDLVKSKNAEVINWSPNKVILQVSNNSEPVILNMNPGRHWTVNGSDIFKHMRITEPNEIFSFYSSGRVVVEYKR